MSISSSKTLNISHILGIDYGDSKIGLAIADSETKIAFGYGVLKNDKEILDKIVEIVEKEGVGKIIIGIADIKSSPPQLRRGQGEVLSRKNQHPSVPSGHLPLSEGRRFGDLLVKKLKNIKIEFQSEIFSTKQAERNLKEKGLKKIKKYDDQEAARIILQSWLDKNK